MSKIQKALRRARGDQKLVLVTTPATSAATESGGQLVPVAGQGAPRSEVESRGRSSAAIALMREGEPLDKNALSRFAIISPEMAEDSTVQAFREIRTKILQKSLGRNCVIMVAGVDIGSGGTFVSLNLSAAFAFDAGKTALLIDCNLRDPSLQRLLPEEKVPGLTDYLENVDMELSQIIHPVGIDRLRVIPAGGNREIPTEYFTSLKMKRLLESVRQRYPERFVILDAPPMTESADTQILAELCDYVLVVVPYAKVTNTQVANCLKSIDAKKLLGVVFNNEPRLPTVQWKELLKDPLDAIRAKLDQLRKVRKKKER
jgi:capsular exopolysaccharide synthesis family protein